MVEEWIIYNGLGGAILSTEGGRVAVVGIDAKWLRTK